MANNTVSFPAELLPLVNVLREVGYGDMKPPLDGACSATNGRQKIWMLMVFIWVSLVKF